MTTTFEAVINLTDLAEGMAAYSNQCHWIRLNDALASALGRPPRFTERSNRRSYVPRSAEALGKLLLDLFRVDAKGAFKNKKGKFDQNGFLLTSYGLLAGMIGYSKRQVERCMADFKKAGLVETRQDIREDGSYGPVRIRLNPWALIDYAKKSLTKGAAKIIGREMSLPTAINGGLLSSDKRSQKSAPSESDSDAAQKKEITPHGGGDSDFPGNEVLTRNVNSNPGIEDFTRKVILQTETGKVVETIKAVFPEAVKAPVEKLAKLHRKVTQGVPDRRLSPLMAERLVEVMAERPETLERFLHLDSEKQGFDVLLDYWPGIRNALLRDQLDGHDATCFSERSFIQEIEHRLDGPVDEVTMDNLWAGDRGQFALHRFANLLRTNGPAAFIKHMSDYVRTYIINRPVVYSIFRRRFPQVVRHCNISETLNQQLLQQANMTVAQAATWDRIKSNYGFEHDETVYERLEQAGACGRIQSDHGFKPSDTVYDRIALAQSRRYGSAENADHPV